MVLQAIVRDLTEEQYWPFTVDPQRAVYCSRTLDMSGIKCIGFDMDYTLINYDVSAWEGRAYDYGVMKLKEFGLPTEGMFYDNDLIIRGLVMDKEKGNVVKIDKFGYMLYYI